MGITGYGTLKPIFDRDIEILPLVKWLNYASGCDESVFVALPLIQRGSVWKPKQIIDLWDSLLRGMPLGSLMYSPMPVGLDVRKIGSTELVKTRSGSIGLIDGQQRTLAMLLAWPKSGVTMDRRIWVDFTDTPGDENLFRLHVTTKNQPFGFQRSSPNAKLSLGERRKAREEFLNKNGDCESVFEKSAPFHSEYPLDLCELIELWINLDADSVRWSRQIMERLEKAGLSQGLDKVEQKISEMARSLARLFKLSLPLLKVDADFFAGRDAEDEASDPPLAVLFKRIGTGGTPLSDADYAYSVIKQRIPETYTLVEELHSDHTIASLLSATDLVMTAVRLAAAEYPKSDSAPMNDLESPNKQEFHRMIKHAGFLEKSFLPLIQNGDLQTAFQLFTNLIAYDQSTNKNGLPPYGLPLLNRPLIQVLLRWIRKVQKNGSPVEMQGMLHSNREDVLRFVMYWQLCVTDPRKASRTAFAILAKPDACIEFPGKQIYAALLEEQVAMPIISSESIRAIKSEVALSRPEQKLLRGWKRFDSREASENERRVIALYQRWWGNGSHVHPMLLWLQRETVAGFEGSPVAGREEDTPYDYDHICPANQWGNWTGSAKGDRLIDFLEKDDGGGHWRIGNSIGNIRVWDSRLNRGDGDAPAANKLALEELENRTALLRQSAIEPSQIEGWRACSGAENKWRSWDEERAAAFQRVVEQRTFALYQRFYSELNFAAWPEGLDAAK